LAGPKQTKEFFFFLTRNSVVELLVWGSYRWEILHGTRRS